MLRATRTFSIFFFVVLFVLTMIPHISSSQTMNIAPHKIVLNAEGKTQTILAIVGMTLESGYVWVTDYDISLDLDETFIAKAVSVRYCPIDDNLLISFDRNVVQTNQDVVELAGKIVPAAVNGSFIISNGSDTKEKTVSAEDTVEIVKPGNK